MRVAIVRPALVGAALLPLLLASAPAIAAEASPSRVVGHVAGVGAGPVDGAQVCRGPLGAPDGPCTVSDAEGAFALDITADPGTVASICAASAGWRAGCVDVVVGDVGTDTVADLDLVAATPPSAPTALQLTGGDASVTVRWSPPDDDGGWAVAGYSVVVSPGAAGCTTDVELSADPTTCTVSGLTNGVEHVVSVVARNPAGTGPAATGAVVPLGPPGSVRSLVVSPGPASGTAHVTWEPPADDGGAAITGYEVGTDEGACTVEGTAALCTGLTGGIARAFAVRAWNAIGPGPASSETGSALDADAPTAWEPALAAASAWSRGPVTVLWGWKDLGAGIDPAGCPESTTSVGEGTVLVQASCRDLVGNVGVASRTVLVDSSAPSARMTSATARLGTSLQLSLSWSGADSVSGVQSWSVRVGRVATSTGEWSGWSAPAAWSAVPATALSFQGLLGFRYCFSVRATDHAGNRSAWSASHCVADPLRAVAIPGSYPGDDPFRIGGVDYRPLSTTPYLGSSGGWYQGHRVTTGFGSARSGHPHSGTDYDTATGEPVKSPCAGVVVRASYTWIFGKHVLLRCDTGRLLLLGHLDSIRTGWARRVSPGTVVGRSGSTGHSTGSHLHVTMWAPSGSLTNAHRWFVATGRPLFWG